MTRAKDIGNGGSAILTRMTNLLARTLPSLLASKQFTALIATRAFSEDSDQCEMTPAPRHKPANRRLPVAPSSETPAPAQSN